MPASVEADGHVRVAASVPVDGARLSGADKGARAPANWSPLAPPVSVWVSLDPVSVPGARRPTGHPGACECVARPASVHGARLACRRPACPRGSRQLVTLPPPARRPPPRQLGQPTGRRALACAPPPPPPPRPPRPSSPSLRRPRARDSLLASRGAPPAPSPPQPTPLNRDPRARRRALLLHIPTDLARPIIVRANVPGSERRSGGRPTCAGRPRAARAAMCPSQLVTALRHQAAAARGSPRPSRPANWRESMEVEIPRDRPSPVPRVSGERCLGPLSAGAAGPVDGRCLPTNLAKDRADAQRLVATRLLDRLHDPLGHFSRLQRIHPRAR
ncbi:hypothetical protein V6Z77_010190 [Aspergillus fumigatus]